MFLETSYLFQINNKTLFGRWLWGHPSSRHGATTPPPFSKKISEKKVQKRMEVQKIITWWILKKFLLSFKSLKLNINHPSLVCVAQVRQREVKLPTLSIHQTQHMFCYRVEFENWTIYYFITISTSKNYREMELRTNEYKKSSGRSSFLLDLAY